MFSRIAMACGEIKVIFNLPFLVNKKNTRSSKAGFPKQHKRKHKRNQKQHISH